MALIKLTEGFSIISEGTHTFKVEDVEYKEEFGKLEVKLVSENNQKHTERYSLIKADGSVNEGASNAFSFFAKTCMNDYTLENIDPQKLIGRYIKANVYHDEVPSNKDPNKTLKFAHLKDMEACDGFEGGEKYDLDNILG